VDAKNPHVKKNVMSRKSFLDLPHLVYGIGIDRQLNLADQHLAQLGIHRRIDVTVESFLLVPFLIQGTQLVSLVLERAAKRLAHTPTSRRSSHHSICLISTKGCTGIRGTRRTPGTSGFASDCNR
jgi:hypothetical protein